MNIDISPSSTVVDNHEQLDLPVQGMTCGNCVRRVERALTELPGVGEARVNFATSQAFVRYDATRIEPRGIVEAIEHAGYRVPGFVSGKEASEPPRPLSAATRARALEEAELAEQRAIRRDFIITLSLTVPLFVLAMTHGSLDGIERWLSAEGVRWLQLSLTAPVVLGPGRRFFRLAWSALRHRSSDMNTLVSIGVLASFGYSTLALLAPRLFPHGEHGALPHVYFEAASAIILFVLLGKLLETRARKRLADAVRGLIALVPQNAHLLRGDLRDPRHEDVGVATLRVGDRVLVRPGESVPIDGSVVAGASSVNESMLTGESLPVDKGAGAQVFAGTLNQSGALTVRVTKTQGETALANIVAAVEQAQGSRAPIARLADVVSSYFVPVVIGIALVTFVVWLAVDPSTTGLAVALERFVAVLVIACPCALGLATPAAVAVGTGRGAELGILVKGGAPLEAASRVDTVWLDKTGTLTAGKPTLREVVGHAGFDTKELLSLIGSVELASEHPVARAIVAGARERGAQLEPCERFVSTTGAGVEARVHGRVVRLGTSAFLNSHGVDTTALHEAADRAAKQGETPSFVSVDDELAGLITVADTITDEARRCVDALREQHIEVVMVTGDRRATAEAIARELGITRVHAEVLPAQKAALILEERARGRRVAMVGDGINDAPALAAADVGIAIGSGTDIAIAAADIALLHGGIGSLPGALKLARRTLRVIRENLFWAFVYNAVGLPLAAGVFYASSGWLLSPVFASAAMSLSSVSVLLNSLRLRRFKLSE